MSTLLLIDDDDEVLSINCKYLSGEGYSVYTASNPTDALKLICQYFTRLYYSGHYDATGGWLSGL